MKFALIALVCAVSAIYTPLTYDEIAKEKAEAADKAKAAAAAAAKWKWDHETHAVAAHATTVKWNGDHGPTKCDEIMRNFILHRA